MLNENYYDFGLSDAGWVVLKREPNPTRDEKEPMVDHQESTAGQQESTAGQHNPVASNQTMIADQSNSIAGVRKQTHEEEQKTCGITQKTRENKFALVLRVIEYSYDNKPDIWYKAQVIYKTGGADRLTKWLCKSDLPKLVQDKCLEQISELLALTLTQNSSAD